MATTKKKASSPKGTTKSGAAKKSTKPGSSPTAPAVVVHAGQELVAIDGGSMVMGTSMDDLLAMVRVVAPAELAELEHDGFGESRPPRIVAVAPFLLGRSLADRAKLGLEANGDLAEQLRALGLRLPSEAEWEWVAREGGATRFVSTRPPEGAFAKTKDVLRALRTEENGWGVRQLNDEGEIVADAWHPSLAGAPPTSAAWEPERGPGVTRTGHTAFQGSSEIRALSAAHRVAHRGDVSVAAFRVARDVPGAAAPAPDASLLATSVRDTVAALSGSAKKERTFAFEVLRMLGRDGLHDVEADELVAPLLAVAGSRDKSEVAAALRAIADIACRGRRELVEARLARREHPLRTALLPRMAPLLDRLDDRDPAVRAAAACVACALPEGAARLAARAAVEEEPNALASLVLALACRGDVARARDVLAANPPHPPIARATAALALAVGGAMPEPPSVAFVAALSEGLGLAATEASMPWLGPGFTAVILSVVERGGPALRDSAIEALVKAAHAAESWPAVGLLKSALALAFGPPSATPSSELRNAATLTPAVRALLTAASEPKLSPVAGHLGLPSYAVPGDLAVRRIWLGLEAPTAADRSIETDWEGARRTWSIAAWLRAVWDKHRLAFAPDHARAHTAMQQEVAPVVAGWDPILRLELSLDGMRIVMLPELAPAVVAPAALAHDAEKARDVMQSALARALRASPANLIDWKLVEIGLLLHPGGDLPAGLVEAIAGRFYMLYGDHMLAAVGAMSPAQREQFLVERFERAVDAYPSSLLGVSLHGFVTRHALPQVVAHPSERTARALVRVAGRGPMRRECWTEIEAARVPAITSALAALGPFRELDANASPEQVQRFVDAYVA